MSRTVPIAVAGLLLALLSGARSEEDGPGPTTAGPSAAAPSADVTSATIQAIEKGLEYLASRQAKDGSFNEMPQANIAVTSLALLAFMSNGNTESRGRYAEVVTRGIDFLLRHVLLVATGKDPAGYIRMDGDEQSRMHGHGYATLALALAYGTADPERSDERTLARRHVIRDRIALAVSVIENAQDDSGGWYYHPIRQLHEGSVTVCMVQALRAARDAGIPVQKQVVDKAVSYLERSQDPQTGGFCYSLDQRDRQTYALTAAALSTLFGLGQYNRDRMIEAGLDFLMDHLDANLSGFEGWFFYANLYASQTLWQAAANPRFAKYWRRWWPRVRDYLIDDQRVVDDDGQRTVGYWTERGGSVGTGTGNVYATSCAVLILSVPMELLPMFQR